LASNTSLDVLVCKTHDPLGLNPVLDKLYICVSKVLRNQIDFPMHLDSFSKTIRIFTFYWAKDKRIHLSRNIQTMRKPSSWWILPTPTYCDYEILTSQTSNLLIEILISNLDRKPYIHIFITQS